MENNSSSQKIGSGKEILLKVIVDSLPPAKERVISLFDPATGRTEYFKNES